MQGSISLMRMPTPPFLFSPSLLTSKPTGRYTRGLHNPMALGSGDLCWPLSPLPHAVKHLTYQLTQCSMGTGHWGWPWVTILCSLSSDWAHIFLSQGLPAWTPSYYDEPSGPWSYPPTNPCLGLSGPSLPPRWYRPLYPRLTKASPIANWLVLYSDMYPSPWGMCHNFSFTGGGRSRSSGLIGSLSLSPCLSPVYCFSYYDTANLSCMGEPCIIAFPGF